MSFKNKINFQMYVIVFIIVAFIKILSNIFSNSNDHQCRKSKKNTQIQVALSRVFICLTQIQKRYNMHNSSKLSSSFPSTLYALIN